MEKNPDSGINAAELARLLQYHRTLVGRWLAEGLVEGVHRAGVWIVPWHEVAHLIEQTRDLGPKQATRLLRILAGGPLTLPEVSRVTGLAPRTIYAWQRAGELQAIHPVRNSGMGVAYDDVALVAEILNGYTARAAARRLGIAPSSLRLRADRGQIQPLSLPGGRGDLHYPRDLIDAWMDELDAVRRRLGEIPYQFDWDAAAQRVADRLEAVRLTIEARLAAARRQKGNRDE